MKEQFPLGRETPAFFPYTPTGRRQNTPIPKLFSGPWRLHWTLDRTRYRNTDRSTVINWADCWFHPWRQTPALPPPDSAQHASSGKGLLHSRVPYFWLPPGLSNSSFRPASRRAPRISRPEGHVPFGVTQSALWEHNFRTQLFLSNCTWTKRTSINCLKLNNSILVTRLKNNNQTKCIVIHGLRTIYIANLTTAT